MQLDIFEHNCDVALRNAATDALKNRDATGWMIEARRGLRDLDAAPFAWYMRSR